MDYSPHKSAFNQRIESKSEYQVPLHHQHTPAVVRQDWDTKSKSRLKPPQTVYQKSKPNNRMNYNNDQMAFETG